MIAHLILFQPRPDVTAEQRQIFVGAIRRAVREIAEIQRVRIGQTVSFGVMPENSLGHKTYDYVAVFEFSDAAALKAYLDHPAHADVRRLFWETCAETVIVDADLVDPGTAIDNWFVGSGD